MPLMVSLALTIRMGGATMKFPASFSAACSIAAYDKLNFVFLRDIAPVASIGAHPVMEVLLRAGEHVPEFMLGPALQHTRQFGAAREECNVDAVIVDSSAERVAACHSGGGTE